MTAREDKSNLKAGREGVRVENQAGSGSLEVLLPRADATVTATTTMHS